MKENDPTLLKLAKYNSKIRETFEIIEDQHSLCIPQYFIMYGMTEGEAFKPDNVVGFRDVSEVAEAMAYYRETGILRWATRGIPRFGTRELSYETVQPLWLYVLRSETIMHKITRFEQYREIDGENI
jgi:hypothetical protein